MKPEALLIPFYQGLAPDSEGRYLHELWELDDAAKESCHDYIQWLFPNQMPSRFNARAPVLTKELLKEMKKEARIIENLKTSFRAMLKFYGLEWASGKVLYADNFNERAAVWLTPYNHNYLRITRILHCLVDFGLREEAVSFKNILAEISRQHHNICQESLVFWQDAVNF